MDPFNNVSSKTRADIVEAVIGMIHDEGHVRCTRTLQRPVQGQLILVDGGSLILLAPKEED